MQCVFHDFNLAHSMVVMCLHCIVNQWTLSHYVKKRREGISTERSILEKYHLNVINFWVFLGNIENDYLKFEKTFIITFKVLVSIAYLMKLIVLVIQNCKIDWFESCLHSSTAKQMLKVLMNCGMAKGRQPEGKEEKPQT